MSSTNVTFIGELIPAFASRDLQIDQQWSVGMDVYSAQVDVRIQMIAGTCTVTFVSPPRSVELPDLYGVARRLASLCLDYAAFRTFVPLELILTTRIHGDGILTVLSPQVDGVQVRQEGNPVDPDGWRRVIAASVSARNALRDYRFALSQTDESMFFLHRCLECIRQEFEKMEEDRETAWARMRSVLNYDRDWTSGIETGSIEQRHGKHQFGTHAQRVEALARVWQVLDRFLQWLVGGRSELSVAIFPHLR